MQGGGRRAIGAVAKAAHLEQDIVPVNCAVGPQRLCLGCAGRQRLLQVLLEQEVGRRHLVGLDRDVGEAVMKQPGNHLRK